MFRNTSPTTQKRNDHRNLHERDSAMIDRYQALALIALIGRLLARFSFQVLLPLPAFSTSLTTELDHLEVCSGYRIRQNFAGCGSGAQFRDLIISLSAGEWRNEKLSAKKVGKSAKCLGFRTKTDNIGNTDWDQRRAKDLADHHDERMNLDPRSDVCPGSCGKTPNLFFKAQHEAEYQ